MQSDQADQFDQTTSSIWRSKATFFIKSQLRSVWTVELDGRTKKSKRNYMDHIIWNGINISFEDRVYFSIPIQWFDSRFDWWWNYFIIFDIMVNRDVFMIFKAQFNPSNSQMGICVFTKECTNVIKSFTENMLDGTTIFFTVKT